jgi:hypothetical protein
MIEMYLNFFHITNKELLEFLHAQRFVPPQGDQGGFKKCGW